MYLDPYFVQNYRNPNPESERIKKSYNYDMVRFSLSRHHTSSPYYAWRYLGNNFTITKNYFERYFERN